MEPVKRLGDGPGGFAPGTLVEGHLLEVAAGAGGVAQHQAAHARLDQCIGDERGSRKTLRIGQQSLFGVGPVAFNVKIGGLLPLGVDRCFRGMKQYRRGQGDRDSRGVARGAGRMHPSDTTRHGDSRKAKARQRRLYAMSNA